MTPRNEDERARQRRLTLDRITARYADEYRAGLKPRIEAYVREFPEFAAELLDFAVYFHTITVGLPGPDPVPAPAPSRAAARALARIHDLPAAAWPTPSPAPGASAAPADTSADASATTTTISGLARRGLELGMAPPQLAEAVGLSPDLLAKLEAHAITAATIPRTLVARLAATLRTTAEAVGAFLGIAPEQAGAFYYADRPPTSQQQPFIEAVQQTSALASERKREWADIVARDQSAE